MRDPDGYLIEVGQYTEAALHWFNNHSLFGNEINKWKRIGGIITTQCQQNPW